MSVDAYGAWNEDEPDPRPIGAAGASGKVPMRKVMGRWMPVTDPQPGDKFFAYREVCGYLFCPYAAPGSAHTHVIEDPIIWPGEAA